MLGFRSKVTIKILNYYFLNPQKSHYVNELARILIVDPANLFRKLKELEREGVLVSEMKGNQRYFSLNKNYPLLKELKKLLSCIYG
jgi:Fic family protein